MSTRRVSVNVQDANRIVLTELLPYEAPLRFSTLLFHARLVSKSLLPTSLQPFISSPNAKWETVPYTFPIFRTPERTRTLSVMHPLQMPVFCQFYERYSNTLLSLCAKSSWSLRRPAAVATNFVDRTNPTKADPDVESDVGPGSRDVGQPEDILLHAPAMTSYFAYSMNPYLWGFFQSRDFGHLEQRFSRYYQLDVASCFDSIYTHSISWASRGKEASKRGRTKSVGCDFEFDRCMRSVNHGETAGIIIGPEVSRLFSEVIFQEIDARAERECSDAGLNCGIEFAVRRYVDDYFVFCNREDVFLKVQEVLSRCLAQFRMSFNPSKTIEHGRPFVTRLSRAKQALSALVSEYMERVEGDDRPPRRMRLLESVKQAIGDHRSSYGECAKYLMSVVRRQIVSRCSRGGDRGHAFLSRVIECGLVPEMFRVFALSPEYQASVVLGRIVSDIRTCFRRRDRELAEVFYRDVAAAFHEVLWSLSLAEFRPSLELANLFVALSGINCVHPIPSTIVKRLWCPGPTGRERGDYFVTMCLLYSFGDRQEYSEIRNRLISEAITRVSGLRPMEEAPQAELFLMGMDLMSCPETSARDKRLAGGCVLKSLSRGGAPSAQKVGRFVNQCSRESWFFDWESTRTTGFYIGKKELSSAYC